MPTTATTVAKSLKSKKLTSSHKYLIAIIGPTAIGKTACTVELAKYFTSEIISADSRQFYKEMSIGTAIPDDTELNAVPHHFIHHISVEQNYTVGDYEKDALEKINELFLNHNLLFLTGGSGLYVDAVVNGLDEFPKTDPLIRQQLNQKLQSEGLESLQQELQKRDPNYFKSIDIQNPHRVIRALEVCIQSGQPFSSFLGKKKNERNFKTIKIGLTAERQTIYDRINKRVDMMMKKGLLDEAQKLYPKKEYNALNTVGYKELFAYFDGEITLETAISEIKKNTRRFAKRQLTWFQKDTAIHWFDHQTHYEEIRDFITQKINHS